MLVQVFQPALVLEASQKWRVAFFAGVPAMLAALLNHPVFDSYDLSAYSAVFSGGDRVPPELVEEAEHRVGVRFSTLFGQTELSPAVTQTGPGDSAHDRLHTGEIEAVLGTHPGVRQAAVLGLFDPAWGEQVAVVVSVTGPADPPTAAELHDHVRAALAPYKTPHHSCLTDILPGVARQRPLAAHKGRRAPGSGRRPCRPG